jgi:membrane fusion protein, multidrug efflux system
MREIRGNKKEITGYPGVILGLSCLVSFFLYTNCNSSTATRDTEPVIQNLPDSSYTLVNSAPVLAKRFEYIIQSNGKVESVKEELVISENGGKLTECYAGTGKIFSAGSPIARFETAAVQHKLERARLSLFNNTREYESQLLGYENLLKDKTSEQAEDIRQKLRISSGLASAEQDIKEANYELTKAVIKAPFTGMLADVKVHAGQQVRPGQELFRIYDPVNLLLSVKVLESDIALLKKGTAALVLPVADPSGKIEAAVYEMNPYVDDNGMVTVKLRLNTGKGKRVIFPGMNCAAVIKVPFDQTLVVPKDAVVMRDGKAVVFTLENGRTKWNYVVTGRENNTELEIKEGLREGDLVIVTNNIQLSHDAPVKDAGLIKE